MDSVYVRQDAPPTPPEEMHDPVIKVYALHAGHLTLPERFFVQPSSATARRTVPSLAFLIEHQNTRTNEITRLVFDLGIRRQVENYAEPIRKHIETRQPLSTQPDITKSLAQGGLKPSDIHYVVYSHIHWDHVGEPRDFDDSTFIVGHGALELLNGETGTLRGSHSFFEPDLLPRQRTIELPPTDTSVVDTPRYGIPKEAGPDFGQPWKSHRSLPRTLDIFYDGSVFIVDAPGHLPGHINLLVKTGRSSSIYLAGDACHDRRILRREREIGEWHDDESHVCCIHANKKQAEETIEQIRQLEAEGIEVIFAHDVEWEEDPINSRRFFGAAP